MKKISRNEMRKVLGGYEEDTIGVKEDGRCVRVWSNTGQSGCWYTKGSSYDLCNRVYGSRCESMMVVGDCTDCIMD